ncbi:hypothetical protein ACFLWU_06760 [Chloroflexota bacterium]
MNTLLEFITLTKGVEYLIAIAFLFAFITFWLYLHSKGKGLLLKILPLGIMTIGLGVLASTCIVEEEQVTATALQSEAPLLSSPVLVEMYGPASFDHDLHLGIVDGCAACHHYSRGETPPCMECHADSFNPEDMHKPGIAHVYHLRCISCHTENQAGPTECTGCHNKATVPPLSITHPLSGAENCLSCHNDGVSGVPGLPDDHTSATNGVCQICHIPSAAAAPATDKLPHDVTGREDCLMCHGEGIGDAAKVPSDHAGRTNDTCQICHIS